MVIRIGSGNLTIHPLALHHPLAGAQDLLYDPSGSPRHDSPQAPLVGSQEQARVWWMIGW